MTESIAALATALAKVQSELPTLERDKTVTVETKKGDPYSYSYVTLARLSAAILPLLAKHGLSFAVMPGTGADGKMAVLYRLMHESGEYLAGEFPVSGEGGIQMIGGRISYIRRYCLAAVVGVAADEDDESNLADEPRPAQRAAAKSRRKSSGQEEAAPVQRSAPPLPGESANGITDPQLAKVSLLFNKIDGWSERDDRLRAASSIVGRSLTTSKELTKAEAHTLIETLEKVTADADPSERLTAIVTAARERNAS